MNDRFRFRVWEEKNNKWLHFDFSTYLTYQERIWNALADGKEFYQSTGLKDKNGTLIYEGDIIKIPEDWDIYGQFAGEVREVYYNEGFRLKPKWDKNHRGNWLEDTKDFEVIGNIYENKSLLESEG